MARIRRIIKGAALAGGLGVAALIGHLAYLHLNGNYHPVIANEVYRAAQITPAEIASYQANDGIRSVLNLRGAFPGEEWYDQEVAASRELGITHVDFKMSASVELSDQQVERLIAVMRDMPKPMLIHCRQGADRSGLAAALYMAAIAGMNEQEAERQLSLRYGHFAVPYLSDAYPMDETWERIEPKLGFAES